MKSVLIVGTKSAQSLNTKSGFHMVGKKTTAFAERFPQVFHVTKYSILALCRDISYLSPVSTDSTTSITSLDNLSIIKTLGCGRRVYT